MDSKEILKCLATLTFVVLITCGTMLFFLKLLMPSHEELRKQLEQYAPIVILYDSNGKKIHEWRAWGAGVETHVHELLLFHRSRHSSGNRNHR